MEADCLPTDFRKPLVLMRSHIFFLQNIKLRYVITSILFQYLHKTNDGSYDSEKMDWT